MPTKERAKYFLFAERLDEAQTPDEVVFRKFNMHAVPNFQPIALADKHVYKHDFRGCRAIVDLVGEL